MQNIGKIIKQYRHQNHLTQDQFGKKLGVNKQTVSKWEKGILQVSTSKYFEIEQIMGDLIHSNNPFIYEKKIKYNVGLNYLFKNICEYNSLYLFLDSLIVAHNLLEPSCYIGFMLVNKTYNDGPDEDCGVIESIRLFEDYILVETSISQLVIFKETFMCIESDTSFNNESYAINCYMDKERKNFIQLIVGFGNDQIA